MQEEKPYCLIVENRKEYLYVCVQAETTGLDLAVGYINEIRSAMNKTGHQKVLLVRKIPVSITSSKYRIALAMMINILPAELVVALVDSAPALNRVKQAITEQLKERSVRVGAFDQFDEAEAWLTSQK